MPLAKLVTITIDNSSNDTGGRFLVWDLPLRIFHWLLAFCFLGSWISAEAGFEWTQTHMRFGYASLALIVFRVFWGLAGTRYSRFSSFRLGPKVLLQKFPELYSTKQSNCAGHSETGSWSTVLLLTLVTIQAGTGLFISDDIFYAGPYNPVVSGSTAGMLAYVHHINFNVLQAVVGLHLAAIAWYAWRKKENLFSPMLHGNKTVKPNLAIPSSHTGRAILAAIIAVALISLLVLLAPEPSMYDFF